MRNATRARVVNALPTSDGSQRGFTLIEVVIAIFLLMLGSLTVLSLVDARPATTSASSRARSR